MNNHLDPNKKILYVDMDGVLTNFEEALFRLFPHLREYEPHSEALGKQIDELCAPGQPGARMFLDMEPIEFAVESFHILYDLYNVILLTSAPWLCHESSSDKRVWAERVLGPKVKKRIVISHFKGLMIGDYLIDDRIKNGVADFKGRHFHFGSEEAALNWPKMINTLSKLDGFVYKIPGMNISISNGQLVGNIEPEAHRWIKLGWYV